MLLLLIYLPVFLLFVVRKNVTIIAIVTLLCPVVAQSAALPANTTIDNTARATLIVDGLPSELISNTVVFSVLPLIDVQNTAVSALADKVEPGVAGYAYSFVVTNTGNARNTFDLSAGFIDTDAPASALWIDKDHDALLNPAVDARVDPVVSTIDLLPGQNLNILVMARAAGTMRLTATSLDGNPAAVVRHDSASAQISIVATSSAIAPSLVKSQSVNTRGAAQPGSGTLITYSLTSHLPASSNASDIRIMDTVPSGTTYVPGTLSLDDASLSDAADGDPGSFMTNTRSVSVTLPGPDAQTPDSTHTVRFQVRIN